MTGDVAVVGAGIVGTTVAWRLAEAGVATILVDPSPFGGASHVAAGMLAPVSEVVPGEERLLALNLDAAARWPGFAREVAAAADVDPGYRPLGTLTAALTRDDLALVDDVLALQRRLGVRVERHLGGGLRRLEPLLAPGVCGGVWAPDDHAVDTRRLGEAVTVAATRAGVTTVRERVGHVELDGDRVRAVVTDAGTRVAATWVVLATGASVLPGLPAEVVAPVRPVKGQILRLRGEIGLLDHVVRGVVRGRHVYAVPRTDGRLVVGATVEERGADTTVTAGGVRTLLDDAAAVLPVVDELELLEVGAGLRPATPDHLPVVGPTAVRGLVHATGHHRGGILLAPTTADAIVALVTAGTVPDAVAGLGVDRFHRTAVSP